MHDYFFISLYFILFYFSVKATKLNRNTIAAKWGWIVVKIDNEGNKKKKHDNYFGCKLFPEIQAKHKRRTFILEVISQRKLKFIYTASKSRDNRPVSFFNFTNDICECLLFKT